MEMARRKVKLFLYLWPALGISGALHYCSNPLSLRMYEIYVKNHDSANITNILPIAGWFPWDSVQYYKYSYLIQVFGVVGCCVGSVSYDQLYVSTLLICSSYLKHLIYSLSCENDGLQRIRYKQETVSDSFCRLIPTFRFCEVQDLAKFRPEYLTDKRIIF